MPSHPVVPVRRSARNKFVNVATKAVTKQKVSKDVKKPVKKGIKKPVEKAVAVKGIKKLVRKRNIVKRGAREAKLIANYKNSQPTEAEMCCGFCVETLGNWHDWFCEKVRFVIRHMLDDHGLNARIDCGFKDFHKTYSYLCLQLSQEVSGS